MTMEELIQEAKDKKLWIRSSYHGIWFSPYELEAEQAKGKFRWGVVNFELADPSEHEEHLKQAAELAEAELLNFQEQVRVYKAPSIQIKLVPLDING